MSVKKFRELIKKYDSKKIIYMHVHNLIFLNNKQLFYLLRLKNGN